MQTSDLHAIEGESLILHLTPKVYPASTGSACSSTKLEPSHVLLAIGLEKEEAHGSLKNKLGTLKIPKKILIMQ